MALLLRRLPVLILLASVLAGCATAHDPKDPWESVNRVTFEVNDTLDKTIIKPIAIGYKAVAPDPVRTWVRNFFSNLNDVVVLANDLLQGKWAQARDDFARVFINSSFGLLGINDIATPAGLEKHDEDLGQTLAVWGLGPGPYFVIPLLGPSTVRDTVGTVGDHFITPTTYIDDVSTRNELIVLRTISGRADLLDVEKVIDEAAIDRYNFIREAYFQRRLNQIHDGNPPRVYDDEDAAAPAAPIPFSSQEGTATGSGTGRDSPEETPQPGPASANEAPGMVKVSARDTYSAPVRLWLPPARD